MRKITICLKSLKFHISEEITACHVGITSITSSSSITVVRNTKALFECDRARIKQTQASDEIQINQSG